MHDVAKRIDSIRSILYRRGREDTITTSNGATFIRHLGKGELSFLHKLFPGCSNGELRKIECVIGFPLPDDYKAFMKFSDGATCFDNTLAIYGLKSNMNRSTMLEEQVPISLENEVSLSRGIGKLEWAPVGSVSAATLSFMIEMCEKGSIRFGNDGCGHKEFPSFLKCLEVLFGIMDNLSDDNGLIDDSGSELERDMFALMSRE